MILHTFYLFLLCLGYDNHNMPPSKVIHCRAVADGCKETDLVQVMRPFGNIRYLKLNKIYEFMRGKKNCSVHPSPSKYIKYRKF